MLFGSLLKDPQSHQLFLKKKKTNPEDIFLKVLITLIRLSLMVEGAQHPGGQRVDVCNMLYTLCLGLFWFFSL